ncbi:protein hold'em [Drosophila sechellia]|uniref:GM11963 n=1 Tax=Drosophila sechellia TaxID=7238 RepID=B4IL53_DROSE|nr:protein hold'em [Drosophila sechellia]EDW53670.1 GM11963 [Drosophila sechellia]
MARRVKFQRLVEMRPTMTRFSTIALIVSKSSPYVFYDKMSGTERGVLTLTIRDSPNHLTNCKCWGQRACVDEYAAMLQIGHVVDIVGAKVMSIPFAVPGEQRYQPQATVSCALVVNEGSGYVVRHDNDESDQITMLQQLLQQPIRPLGAVLKLADVRSGLGSPDKIITTNVNLLVVVAAVRPVRQIKRKLQAPLSEVQELLQCLEVIVIDASYPEGMLLSVWQPDWIQRAQLWQPRRTVLHLIDVRVSYSNFHCSSVLSHSNCTLICENPQAAGDDCRLLLAFAATVPLTTFSGCDQAELDNMPAVASIQAQMTVRQIYSRAEGELQDPSIHQFTAVLYGMVTKFDLDGLTSHINRKCTACQRHIPRNLQDCASDACQEYFLLGNDEQRSISYFNINIHLSDQTGTLVEARLAGHPAERILGLRAEDFERLAEREKSELKWRFLLKYFEVRLMIKKPVGLRNHLVVVVVDIQAIPLENLVANMAVF